MAAREVAHCPNTSIGFATYGPTFRTFKFIVFLYLGFSQGLLAGLADEAWHGCKAEQGASGISQALSDGFRFVFGLLECMWYQLLMSRYMAGMARNTGELTHGKGEPADLNSWIHGSAASCWALGHNHIASMTCYC